MFRQPGALLVRAVFRRDAYRLTAALAHGAPETGLVADVAYRSGDPDAYLDVYTPTGTTQSLPTILWTHGGAWISGCRKDYAGYYRRLANAGFTVVSVGYSIAPERRYPTAVHQVNDAHGYLLAHAEELRIDPERIVLAGDSAGAQLSAQLAVAVTVPEVAGVLGLRPALSSDSLRGVVLHCGIYDVPAMGVTGGLVGWGVQQALSAYTGRRDFRTSREGLQMSSLRLVTECFPRTLISGGNADPLTATQSKPLAARLSDLGVTVDEVFYPDDHPTRMRHEYQFDLSLQESRDLFGATVSFVRDVSRPTPASGSD